MVRHLKSRLCYQLKAISQSLSQEIPSKLVIVNKEQGEITKRRQSDINCVY